VVGAEEGVVSNDELVWVSMGLELDADIPVIHIARSPPEDVSVQGDYERRVACFLRAVQHGDCDFFVFVLGPVELEPSDAVAVRLGDVFDACACCCAQDVRDVVLGGGAGGCYFAVGVEDACERCVKNWSRGHTNAIFFGSLTLNTNRRSRNRKLKFLVEDLGAQIRKSIALDKPAGNDRPLLESIHILLCCLSSASVADNVSLAGRRHDRGSLGLPFCRAEGKRRTLVSQAILVDGFLVLHRVGDWFLDGRHYCCVLLEMEVRAAGKIAVARLFFTVIPPSTILPAAEAIILVVIQTSFIRRLPCPRAHAVPDQNRRSRRMTCKDGNQKRHRPDRPARLT
jgi:hypothetical protein